MNELIKTNSLPNLAGEGEKLDFLPQQNLRKERDIWYKIKLIYSVLIKKISSLLSVDYYKSNNENQFKDIQLQLHATNVTNPYTFSIQGNKSFSGICELDKPSYVIAYGSKPWYNRSYWKDSSKVSDLTTINGGAKFSVKNVTNTGSMFYNCSSLTSLDLSNFNTSNVTDMNSMFYYCSDLISLDLSNFDTSKVTDMSGMFNRCPALETLDYSLNGFLNNSKAPNLSVCTKLKTLRLHHVGSASISKFIEQAKPPSTCNVTQVA